MERELLSTEKSGIVLEDGRHFSYSITPVEIANSLGATVALLDEYFITNFTGETYKLHKTKEGNWYDVPETNPLVNKGILMSLKMAIDSQSSS
jgi:hypothetical protein